MRHTTNLKYSSHNADLVYAVNQAGRIVHVSEVESGLKCNCICPSCGNNLVARKGAIKTHHFSHAKDLACDITIASETALHKLAKQIIKETKELRLPKSVAKHGNDQKDVVLEQTVNFEHVDEETTDLKGLIPDISAYIKERRLLVEVLVTHACDEEKIEKIRAANLSALEIDLSSVPRDAPVAAITEFVCFTAPRKWICHPKTSTTENEMAIKAAAEALRLKEVKDRKLSSLELAYKQNLSKIQALQNYRIKPNHLLARLKLESHIGIKTGGQGCFKCSSREWQTEILHKIIWWAPVKVISIHRTSQDLVDNTFKYISNDMESMIKRRLSDFSTAPHAIKEYLEYLISQNILKKSYGSELILAPEIEERFAPIREAVELKKSRNEKIKNLVAAIISRLHENQQKDFSIEEWLSLKQKPFGISFESAIASNHRNYPNMEDLLIDIKGMVFVGGPIIEETLSLPIEDLRERCREKIIERDRAVKAAQQERLLAAEQARKTEIEDIARSYLDDADTWLAELHPDLECQSPVTYAAVNDANFRKVKAVLSTEATKRVKDKERDLEIARARGILKKEATRILGEERGMLFISATHPKISAKPNDFCKDQRSLDMCLSLLTDSHKAKKR